MLLFQRRVISYHSFIFLSSSFFRTFSFRREELVCQVLTAKNILSESFSLVKNFFYFFFAAFSVFQQRIVCYHIVSDLSTTIFNFLGTFSLCSDSEIYITIGSHFCQHFLWFFYQYIVYLFQTSFFFLFIRKELILFPTFPVENLNFFEKPLTNPSYRRMMNPKRIVPVGKATTGIWTAAAK